MANLRVMFVNTSEDTPVTVTAKTEDRVDYFQLGSATPKSAPEMESGLANDHGVLGLWTRTINPGEIYGTFTNKPINIYNPAPGALTIVYANGKDPWPQPPPRSNALSQIHDYAVRFQNFLLASGPVAKAPPTTCALVLFPDGKITPRKAEAPPRSASAPVAHDLIQAAVVQGARNVHALLITGYDINQPGEPVVVQQADKAVAAVEADLQQRFSSNGSAVPSTNTIHLHTMPTRAEVSDALTTIRGELGPNDLVVVMFAGHGQPADRTQGQQLAWLLSPNELFTINDLSNSFKGFPAATDTVVINDCCYGSGFFRAHLPDAGATAGLVAAAPLPPSDPTLDDKLSQLRELSVAMCAELVGGWDNARGDNDPGSLVSIAAASERGTVLEHNMDELASQVVLAARKRISYSALKTSFIASQAAGRTFFVDARPRTRFDETVLGTEPSSQPAPATPTNDR